MTLNVEISFVKFSFEFGFFPFQNSPENLDPSSDGSNFLGLFLKGKDPQLSTNNILHLF